jgi:membrane protein implicated in regulation of membrane protease activity
MQMTATVNMALIWLIAMIVLLIVEAVVPGLVSIWFALGALAALIAAILHAPMWLQLVWFFVVSIAALVLTRPLAKKYVNSRVKPTNADMILGKECVVTEEIDNIRGTGAVTVGGKVWTARMENDGETAAVGEVLKTLRIEGVKLIVSKA